MSSADEAMQPKTSGMAVAGLVLGILALLTFGITAIPGLVFGIIGLVQINNNKGRLRGRGMAIAGVICAGFSFLVSFLILPAVLFPVFARAQEQAKQATCLSNVKQISLAILMYADDYDGRYPLRANWADAVLPYNKNQEMFQCPKLPIGEGGYAFNKAMAGAMKDGSSSDAAFRVVVFESRPGKNVVGGQADMEARHMGGLTVGYGDGHCNWRRPEMLRESDEVKWMLK